MKGREERKKKKKMDTCHRWSGEAAAAKTPAGSAGPKPTGGREEGLAARPGAGWMEDGQRGRGTAWPRQDGWRMVEPERREVFAFVLKAVCACMCLLPGLRTPAGSAPCRLPAASPAVLPLSCPWPAPWRCQPFAARGEGKRGLWVPSGLGRWLQRGDLPSSGHARRGQRGRLRLCLVGLCLPAAVPGAARGGEQGWPRWSGEGVSRSPAGGRAGTWEPSPAPKLGLPQSRAWEWGRRRERVGREPSALTAALGRGRKEGEDCRALGRGADAGVTATGCWPQGLGVLVGVAWGWGCVWVLGALGRAMRGAGQSLGPAAPMLPRAGPGQ